VVLLLLVIAAATGASSRSAVAAASPSCGGVAGCAAAVTGSPQGLTAEQTANARAIGSVAVGLGERGPRRGQPTTERNTSQPHSPAGSEGCTVAGTLHHRSEIPRCPTASSTSRPAAARTRH